MTVKSKLSLRFLFSVAAIAVGMTGAGLLERHHRSEIADFNPVKDFLVANNLLDAAKQDPYDKVLCNIDRGALELPALAKEDRFMMTFDLCAAAGNPAYKKNIYNPRILNPPPGQTSEEVMREFRSIVAREMTETCLDGAKNPDPNDTFLTKFCLAEGHPIFPTL